MGLDLEICKRYDFPIQYHDQIPREWKRYFRFLTVRQMNDPDRPDDCVYRDRLHSYSGFHYWYRRPLINWYMGWASEECECETVSMPVPYNHLVNFSDSWGVYIPVEFDNVLLVDDSDKAPPIGSLPHLISSFEKLLEILEASGISGKEEDDEWFREKLHGLLHEFRKAMENGMVVAWW